MNLVWIFDGNVLSETLGNHVGQLTPQRKIILMNYFTQSILSAKKYGYNTIVYCDESSTHYFENTANEIIVVDCSDKHLLYDSLRMYVLEHRDDEYCVIDGDVILHNKLPEFIGDVVFDAYEISNYNSSYQPILNQLTNLNIKDVIPFWEVKKIPIICVGLLSIRNEYIKKKFLKYYKIFYDFIEIHKNNIQLDYATAIGSQYLLTLCAMEYNLQPLSNIVGYDNPYYKHHCGSMKYDNPIVPTNYLIKNIDKKNLM